MNTKQFITTLVAVCVLAGGAVAVGWLAAQDGSFLSRGLSQGLAAVAGSGNTGTTQGGSSTGGLGGASATVSPITSTDTGVDGTTPVLPPPPTTPTTPVVVPANPAVSTEPVVVTPPPANTTLPPTINTPSRYRAPVNTGRAVSGTTIAGLKYRDSGSAVSRLQRCLVNAGTLDSSKMSGVFDKATRNALFLYQNGNRAPRTGIVDAKTNALMTSQKVCDQKIELPEEPRPLPALLQEA